MPAIDPERLRAIKTLPQLLVYLRNELDWPIENEDVEDLTFDYQPGELGLDAATAVKIKEIKQLRPLTGQQPWGIFWVNFEKKRLPVVIMRRILRALVLKQRVAANAAERKAWQADDLLFISAYGEDTDRAITLAHFIENEDHGNLAELRVLGWDDDDTPLKYDYILQTLEDKLHWRNEFASDANLWRKTWCAAFTLRHREVIKTSQELALALAGLAKRIRGRVRSILRYEDGFGQIRKLQRAFQQGLIHDLTDEDFADMLAQTVTYGLFSVAVRRTFPGLGTAIVREDVPDLIITSPFLREMLGIFLGIKTRKGKLDFDELGVADVEELLRSSDTHMEAVLRDFGNRTRQEDPVIHFYEHFLTEYDKQRKVQRGVFYTPQPVVSYIVRSVHELLQTEFGLEDGLASTVTWGEMLKRKPELKLPLLTDEPKETRTISPDEPFVAILDPATGTGTFLVETIQVIHQTMTAKWSKLGKSAGGISKLWNEYVPKNLLPRLYGYELMMAPYAIAHMKIGLKLSETGYRFVSEERARIYLTNSLEPKVAQLPHISFEALAHEAKEVNEVKWYKRFTVVIGNPPYSSSSQNREQWAMQLIEDYKTTVRDAETQIQALSDDYVKFTRLAQLCIEKSFSGIVGFITNNNFQSATTFRDMRGSLAGAFNLIQIIDLHGNGRLKETAPDGTTDENVFDILAGVCISIYVSAPQPTAIRRRTDLLGERHAKYDWLATHSLINAEQVSFQASPPQYSFLSIESGLATEYETGISLPEMFGTGQYQKDKTTWYGSGFKTQQDEFAIGFTKDELRKNVHFLLDSATTEASLRSRFVMCATEQWSFDLARRELSAIDWQKYLCPCVYRPFDTRFTVIHRAIVSNPRTKIMAQFIKPNVGICVGRQGQAIPGAWNIVFATRHPEDQNLFYRGGNTIFPLYWNDETSDLGFAAHRRHNLSQPFLERLSKALSLSRDRNDGLPHGLTPEHILHYVYAVLHSNGYRRRYAEFLKVDFPRLPLTSSLDLFRALAKLGGELVALHLMEFELVGRGITPSRKTNKTAQSEVSPHQQLTEFIGGKNPEVVKVSYADETVWVDKAQTEGFRGVPEPVWNFHIGGYQVCEKWLKDRKGRTLTKDDLDHYHRIVVALSETIRLMSEIDQVIEKHGGWPGAFQKEKP